MACLQIFAHLLRSVPMAQSLRGVTLHMEAVLRRGRNSLRSTRMSGLLPRLSSDGSISAWGHESYSGCLRPGTQIFTAIYSTQSAFAALASDGAIYAWGDSSNGGSGAPLEMEFSAIYSTRYAFAALAADGSISGWGAGHAGGSGAPSGSGFISITSTQSAFAALAGDGSISAWGHTSYGGSGAPSGSGFTAIYSTQSAFAALTRMAPSQHGATIHMEAVGHHQRQALLLSIQTTTLSLPWPLTALSPSGVRVRMEEACSVGDRFHLYCLKRVRLCRLGCRRLCSELGRTVWRRWGSVRHGLHSVPN